MSDQKIEGNVESTNVEQIEENEMLDEETMKALKNAKFDTDYFSNKNKAGNQGKFVKVINFKAL